MYVNIYIYEHIYLNWLVKPTNTTDGMCLMRNM